MAIWSWATKTEGFQEDHIGAANQASLAAQFMRKMVSASDRLWTARFRLHDRVMSDRCGISISADIQHLQTKSRIGQEDDPMIDEEDVAKQERPLSSDGSGVDMHIDDE